MNSFTCRGICLRGWKIFSEAQVAKLIKWGLSELLCPSISFPVSSWYILNTTISCSASHPAFQMGEKPHFTYYGGGEILRKCVENDQPKLNLTVCIKSHSFVRKSASKKVIFQAEMAKLIKIPRLFLYSCVYNNLAEMLNPKCFE